MPSPPNRSTASPAGRHERLPQEFRARVLAVLARLQAGDVLSYGDLAAEAGTPGAARGAGAVLAGLGPSDLPWWRVVYADGRLAPRHAKEQAARLAAEGVEVRRGRVAGVRNRGRVAGVRNRGHQEAADPARRAPADAAAPRREPGGAGRAR